MTFKIDSKELFIVFEGSGKPRTYKDRYRAQCWCDNQNSEMRGYKNYTPERNPDYVVVRFIRA